jgi:esterase/lipase superfamily enzyme
MALKDGLMDVARAAPLLVLLMVGCGPQFLVTTPNLLNEQASSRYFADCPADCRRPEMEVLYATDRSVAEGTKGPVYGYGRSRRLAFGVATVSLDPVPTWPELVQASTRRRRRRDFALQTGACRELGAFKPRQCDRQGDHDADLSRSAEALVLDSADLSAFHHMLQDRLSGTAHKDVFVFIHGFNNSFENAVFRAAEVWHFLGRIGVPLVYTWPAGYGGLRGYAYDRESGEFTVAHLKRCLWAVAACPGVERVHLIAHSRGADVTISALRELHVACRARGGVTQHELKLENLVLAAPDLDEDVFLQRFVAEDVLSAVRRTTIYASPRDKVMELADLVFASRGRLGTLTPRDFSPRAREALARLPNLQFVECKVTHFSNSHDYIFTHPAALSDLILVLRSRSDPGVENGRPLLQTAEGIWELSDNYPGR